MSLKGWTSRKKRAREASVREQEAVLDHLLGQEEPIPSELIIHREIDGSTTTVDHRAAFPSRLSNDPYAYYRLTPHSVQPNIPSSHPINYGMQGASTKSVLKPPITSQKQMPTRDGQRHGSDYPRMPTIYGYYPYPYYYPAAYANPSVYGSQPVHGNQPLNSYPMSWRPENATEAPQEDDDDEDDDVDETNNGATRSGLMTIQGRRPLFLVALFVVSIAVLLVSFPLTLLAAGYIGPLGLMFATGPCATVFAFWAIYLTPCECYPNAEWATSRIRVFATTAATFDAVGMVGIPISMYGAQCPDDDDTMLGCEDELPAAKGISMAVSVVLIAHLFLCLLVRSNARKLAQSRFGDEKTEGITLTPNPYRQ